jgi:hypothetical protein
MSQWHQLQAEDVLRLLASDAGGGLSEAESRRRLVQYGPRYSTFYPTHRRNGRGWRPSNKV